MAPAPCRDAPKSCPDAPMEQMACDRAQVSRFTGRKIAARVLSEATGIDPVHHSDARSGPEHGQ